VAFAVIAALVFGFAAMLVLARYARNPAVLRAEFEARRLSTPPKPEIDPGRLRFIVNELLESMGLRIVTATPVGSEGVTRLVATTSGVVRDARYIIYLSPCPEEQCVDAPTLLALAEDVTHSDASLGIVVTPHEIDRSGVAGMAMDLELIDGRALLALIAEHLPARVREMETYHHADAGTQRGPSRLHARVGRALIGHVGG
jgi:hypothetical protein